MYRLGLTGGIATGKSTVAQTLKAHEIPVIDADATAHALMQPGTAVYDQIVATFGVAILQNHEAGQPIDRKQLGAIVFADEQARAQLNAITHPAIFQAMADAGAATKAPLVVFDIPLLFEKGPETPFPLDGVVVVTTSPEQQLERLMARNNLTETEAKQRIASQMPVTDKVAYADWELTNTGTPDELAIQVTNLVTHLTTD